MRDHEPIKITKFNGLWKRGDVESTPNDHFSDCDNIEYIESGFQTRAGIDDVVIDGASCFAGMNIRRMYTYIRPDRTTNSFLILDSAGNIYDTGSPTPCTPILSIPEMTDFAYASWGGRAYISPHDGVLGLEGEFVYVYLGFGAAARKAAGDAPTGAMTAANDSTTNVKLQAGQRIFGVVFETNTGFLTKIGGNVSHLCTGAHMVTLTNVPISAQSFVIKRHIVSTKAIDPVLFTGNLEGYEFFFVPDAIIDDNVTTTISNLDFYDADLVDSAQNLMDLLEEVPAGVSLSLYHSRLIVAGFFGEANADPDLDTSGLISTARVSEQTEPEAFDAVFGIIVAPIDGTSLTNAQEYRDILYLFKNTRTYAYTDNGDTPSTWPVIIIDQGVGCPTHGIALVLDSGGTNVDFLTLASYAGVILFNGGFIRPELSWKIQTLWLEIDKDDFHKIQILNDSVSQRLYLVLPDQTMLYADYSNGMNPKDIRWAPWSFDGKVNTIALADINVLYLGIGDV